MTHWSTWQPGYAATHFLPKPGFEWGVKANRSAFERVPIDGSTYDPAADQHGWASVVSSPPPTAGGTHQQNIGPFRSDPLLGSIAGAGRASNTVYSGSDDFYNIHRLITSAHTREIQFGWTQKLLPNAIDPSLAWGDFVAIPGSSPTRYIQYDAAQKPVILRAGVTWYRARGACSLNPDSGTLSFPVTMTVTFELDPDMPPLFESDAEVPKLLPGPGTRTSLVVRQSQESDTELELVSAPVEVTFIPASFEDDWRFELQGLAAHLQASIDADNPDEYGLWLGTYGKAGMRLYVDGHQIESLSPPAWGGDLASYFVTKQHQVGVTDAEMVFWYEIQWPQWRYWLPFEAGEAELKTIMWLNHSWPVQPRQT